MKFGAASEFLTRRSLVLGSACRSKNTANDDPRPKVGKIKFGAGREALIKFENAFAKIMSAVKPLRRRASPLVLPTELRPEFYFLPVFEAGKNVWPDDILFELG